MARRKVTHTRKHDGRIIALGNPEEWWSPRSVIDASVDTDTGLHRYYAVDSTGKIVPLRVTHGPRGAQLGVFTMSAKSLLCLLPDC